MKPASFFVPLCVLVLNFGAVSAPGDIILNWNIYVRETIKRDSEHANPGYSTRAMAIMNAAMYDCFQAVNRTHAPFRVDLSVPPSTSRAAAASEAAFRVLTALYPAESIWLNWANGYNLNLVPNGPGKQAGIALGDEVAARYLAWRAGDGSDSSVPYQPSEGPGKWRPDPLFSPTQVAWGPEWGAVQPFVLENSMQFAPRPAPALTSAEYTAAWEEVRQYGAKASPVRSADQTEIGLFWAYDRSGLGPPPVLYNLNLHEIAVQRRNTESQNARLFALASVAMADAAIAAWDAKFADNFWRPVSGIREADSDGNPATPALPAWEPLGCPGGGIFPDFTPPFPAYPSGHATMGEAVFTCLKIFCGTDEAAFHLTSAELPGVTRHYSRFSQAAQENADSRVWLGVHWRFDQTEGQKLGDNVARYVAGHRFAPVPEPFAAFCARNGLSGNPADDRDKDGSTDFLEYAFSTDPGSPDPALTGRRELLDGVPCLTLRYARRPARMATGLIIRAQQSSDLLAWTDAGTAEEADPELLPTDDSEFRRVRVPVPPSGKVYLRLHAVSP